MKEQPKFIEQRSWIRKAEKFEPLFRWLRLFYPRSAGISYLELLYNFLPQKILRINGRVPWPVHWTSTVYFYKKIKTGRNCAPGSNSCCYIQGRGGIIIGDNLRMGPGVGLISANHNPDDYDQWIIKEPIKIGNNVWIGMNVVVMPGVKIGDNVIIGANSVVNKDIPSDCVAAGVPCEVIKSKGPYLGAKY
jgi:acetyltransferase-like isoleucine patch superfamily enzyme